MDVDVLEEIKRQNTEEAEQFYKDFNIQQTDTDLQKKSILDSCPWFNEAIKEPITVRLSNSTNPIICF